MMGDGEKNPEWNMVFTQGKGGAATNIFRFVGEWPGRLHFTLRTWRATASVDLSSERADDAIPDRLL
jgi:hypothetical protein